jgi:Protein of unknown function (DUF935)
MVFFKNPFKKKEKQTIEPIPGVTIELKEQAPTTTKLFGEIENDYWFRSKQTIKTWREALSQAEDPTNPNRWYLLDIYRDIEIDTSVVGAVQQRTERVLSTEWQLQNKDGKLNSEINSLFHSKWFYDLLQFNMESIFYGHSLVHIDGITVDNNISNIRLVPRANVIPEFGELKKNPLGGESISYRTKRLYPWLLEYAKNSTDLGLYMKLTPIVLYKKEAMKAWNRFSELYGMPLRVVKTPKKNPQDRQRLYNMVLNMASNAVAVLDMEDNIEFISSPGGDASGVYENLIKMLNKEIYKAILGQTMSSEDSASYSQAFLHNKMFNYKAQMDLRNLEFWTNDILIPKLKDLGLFSDDVTFKFIDTEKLMMTERINIDSMLLQHYKLDPDYISERYSVPVVGFNENQGSPEKIQGKDEQKPDITKKMK